MNACTFYADSLPICFKLVFTAQCCKHFRKTWQHNLRCFHINVEFILFFINIIRVLPFFSVSALTSIITEACVNIVDEVIVNYIDGM
jgi:hypothetical protein